MTGSLRGAGLDGGVDPLPAFILGVALLGLLGFEFSILPYLLKLLDDAKDILDLKRLRFVHSKVNPAK